MQHCQDRALGSRHGNFSPTETGISLAICPVACPLLEDTLLEDTLALLNFNRVLLALPNRPVGLPLPLPSPDCMVPLPAGSSPGLLHAYARTCRPCHQCRHLRAVAARLELLVKHTARTRKRREKCLANDLGFKLQELRVM